MPSASLKALAITGVALGLLLLAATVLLARNNIRRGRGDRRGAMRLAAFTAFLSIPIWAFAGSHVPGYGELVLLLGAVSDALLGAGIVWVLYMAVEPIARRRWPHSMIGWNRLLAGGFRDPLVGRDVLAGLAFGAASALAAALHQLAILGFGSVPLPAVSLSSLLGVRGALAAFLSAIPSCVIQALIWFVLLFVLRVILRRDWLAAGAFVLIYIVLNILTYPAAPATGALFAAVETALLIYAMLRFGLLALVAASFVYVLTILFPITADFSVWYAGASLFAVLGIAAIAAFAFRNSLAGQPLFGDAEL